MIKLNLVALDYIDGDSQVSAAYNIEGLTTENLLTIGDIGYSSTFKNSKIKLTLEETDSLQLFAICDLLDDVNFEPIAEEEIDTQVYLDIFETSDLIYIGEVKGNRVEDTDILIRAFEQWLKTKDAVKLNEDLDSSRILYTKPSGEYLEANSSGHGYAAYNKHNVYIGHISADSDEEAINKFMAKEPKYESLEESEDGAWSEEEVRAELIRMTNNFKKNEGEITTWYEEEKDHIKNILEAASYQVEISDGRKNKDEDMNWVITFVKKVNESLTESLYLLSLSDNLRNWSVAVEADSEEAAKDTFYANVGNDTSIKISSIDEVEEKNLSKDIKIVRKHPVEESLDFDYTKKLTVSEMYDFLLKVGAEEGCDIILDWRYDNDLATPKTIVEWLDLIIETYYDLEDDLRREGDIEQIERNRVEVIDPLEDLRDEMNNEALVKIDEIYYEVLSYNDDSGDDDFDDYLTFGEAEKAFEEWVRDFKTNGVNGAVELLQVDDAKRTSKQLRYWSSEDDKLYKYDESLSNGYCDNQAAYEKLDKFMSDSEEDMNNFYEARTKEDLLDVLETAIVDEDRFLSYAGKHATLEGFAEYILDNKLNESIQEETVIDYGCDKCGKRVPEDKIHWFYGAEVGLCNDCHSKMTDEERYQLDDGDFSSLKEANKTKAQRHNDMMNKVFDNAKKQNQILKDILKDNGISEEEIAELEKATGLHGSALHKKVYDLGLNNEFAKRLGLKEDLTENHLTLDGDTLDTIKDFINNAFEYMSEDEIELSDEVTLYATPTRDRENNQEVTFDVIENDIILDSVVGYPGNTEYCYETITSILREQTGLVKMSKSKEEDEDKAMAYSEILNAKIKINPNRHPADERMFCGTYFIGTYEEGDLAGQEYVFVLADSEGHRFMNEYLGYPKDENGYVDQPTDVITLNGKDEVYFMVEPEELFKEKVEESIVMNENTSDPDFDTIEQALMGIKGTAKVEFDYRPNDGIYKKPQDHFIVLVFENDLELEDETTLNIFNDATAYFKNRKQWKLGVINKLKELGWKLEDPIEDNSSYLYLVMERIKPEAKTEGYETLDGNKVEVYSDYETAKSRALMLGLKEAEYGDEFGSDISYCAWNKSGDRNKEVEVLAYYKFENGKPVALTDEEKATVESVKEITFDDITGPINLN